MTILVGSIANILEAQKPDLVPVDLQAPSVVVIGETNEVAWEIANQGTAEAQGYWEDELRLSVGTDLRDWSTTLARVSREDPVPVGGTYAGRVQCHMPSFAGLGQYYLLLCADRRDFLDELDQTNNILVKPLEVRGADLVMTQFETPTTIGFDRPFEVAWVVSNMGNATAWPDWTDRLYLSTDERLSALDLQLDPWAQTNALPPGTAYRGQSTQVITAGSVPPGDNFLILVCDRDSVVPEPTGTNNYLVRPVFVTEREPFQLTGPSTYLGTRPDPLRFDPPAETDRVEFTFNGEYLGTAYGPDFAASLNSFSVLTAPMLALGEARIVATAYAEDDRIVGMSATERFGDFFTGMPCRIEVKQPRLGYTLYTDGAVSTGDTILIRVEALRLDYLYEGQGAGIFHLPGETGPQVLSGIDDAWIPTAPVRVYIDSDLIHTSTEVPSGDYPYHEFEYTTQGLTLGEHQLSVYAVPPEGYQGAWDSRQFWVELAQPEFGIGREILRRTNHFEVEVTIHNRGAGSATLQRMVEPMTGFQACNVSVTLPFTNIASAFSYISEDNLLTIDFGGEQLAPGTDCTVTYRAVPILFRTDCDYVIGGEEGVIEYVDPYGAQATEDWHETTTVTGPWASRRDLEDAVGDALRASDYLLLTDPVNLIEAYGADGGNGILTDMAELATLRNGVLAYYHTMGMIRTDFRPGVFPAVGRVFKPAESQEQLIIGHAGQDRIHAYFENYEEMDVDADGDGDLDALFTHDIREDDALAVGNVRISYSSGTNYHANAEIIVAWGSERDHSYDLGRLFIYQYEYDTDPAMAGQFTVHEEPSSFVAGDRLTTGDVFIDTTGSPRDEIIIAHATGTIEVRELLGLGRWTTFETDFDPSDFFVVGDFLGDTGLEMVVGRTDTDELVIYTPAGYERTWTGSDYEDLLQYDLSYRFGHQLDPEDGLAVGDVCGDGRDEIVLADASDNRIVLIGYQSGAARFDIIDRFDLDYGANDDLQVGYLASTGKEQILVLRGSDYQGRPAGTVEMINYTGGEEPGDRWALDALINIGGRWADQLSTNWTEQGHLLIVGENEIIPTFTKSWDISGWDHDDVGYTDRNYASTQVGSDYDVPELAVGRMPGNTAERICQALRSAIEVAQDPSHLRTGAGYCVSGTDDDHEDKFVPLRQSIAETLEARGFTVLQRHTPDAATFITNAFERDVIFFSGHGNRRSSCGIGAGDIHDLFDPGSSRPLVYAASCLTGRYPDGTTITEEFLWRGAAAYIGATEVTWSYGTRGRGWCPRLAEAFFRRLAADRTIGRSFTMAKQYRLSDDANSYSWDWDKNRYTCATYHLYGDPKLEIQWSDRALDPMESDGPGRPKGPGSDDPLPGPITELRLDIPSYEVTSYEGIDHVEIPGEELVTVPGWPEVPFYAAAVRFPKGTIVQDVTLEARAEPILSQGLNLEPIVPWTNGPTGDWPPVVKNSGWWPDREFAWSVSPRADGSSILTIKAFPFHYHTDTTEARFHTNYTFGIDYAESTLEIISLRTARIVYPAGALVTADLYLQHTNAEPVTVDVEPMIMANDREETVPLPPRRLANLRGLGWCQLTWNSQGFPGGEYALHVEVKDTMGVRLARGQTVFQLGSAHGLITDLAVEPRDYRLGDDIQLSAGFQNTGSSSVDGTIIIAIFDASGNLETEFRGEFTDLAPGAAHPFEVVWQSATLVPRNCRVVAYAQFAGRTTAMSVAVDWSEAPLRWDSIRLLPEGVALRWPSVAGRRYRLEFTPDLGSVPFEPIAVDVPATPPQNEIIDTLEHTRGFYRVWEE